MVATGLLTETLDRPTAAASPGDGELLAQAAGGDRGAFRHLHGRYEAYVHWLALRMLAEPRDAEDAAQEAWLRVHRGAAQLSDPERFRGWLRAIVVRVCLDLRRGRSPEEDPPLDAVAPPSSAPAERIDLERALRGLPDEQRLVVVLHDVEGLRHDEVAELLGIRPEASRQRLSRGRRGLRRRLEEA